MMIQVLPCPNCQGTDIVRHDQTRQGKQRYHCREPRCAGCTFLLADRYPEHSPEVRQQIVEIARKASGIRDTALDDMWSDVRSTATPRGWWQAIDQRTGQGLGEVVGPRQEAVFVKWQAR